MSIVNEEGLDVKKKHIVIAMMAFIILLSVAYLQFITGIMDLEI